jgi:hypothetical protein
VHKGDQRPERDGTEPGHYPDHQRKPAQRQKADRPLVSRFRSVDPDQFGGIGGGGQLRLSSGLRCTQALFD